MTEQPTLRVTLETHHQHLEAARSHIEALRQWTEQLQLAIDESEKLYLASAIGQRHTRRLARQTGPQETTSSESAA